MCLMVFDRAGEEVRTTGQCPTTDSSFPIDHLQDTAMSSAVLSKYSMVVKPAAVQGCASHFCFSGLRIRYP